VCTVLHLVGKENNGIPPVTNNLSNLTHVRLWSSRIAFAQTVGASDSKKILKTDWSEKRPCCRQLQYRRRSGSDSSRAKSPRRKQAGFLASVENDHHHPNAGLQWRNEKDFGTQNKKAASFIKRLRFSCCQSITQPHHRTVGDGAPPSIFRAPPKLSDFYLLSRNRRFGNIIALAFGFRNNLAVGEAPWSLWSEPGLASVRQRKLPLCDPSWHNPCASSVQDTQHEKRLSTFWKACLRAPN
jgi:hypothetical protein